MSFLFRAASALNVGAGAALKSVKCHRPTWDCVHFATSAYSVTKIVSLDGYKARRANAAEKLKTATRDLRVKIVHSLDKMTAINGREIQELIFTAEEADVDLVIAALKRSVLQSERLRFSSFKLDAVAMRMFAYLNLPDKALEAFRDEDLKTVFVGYNAVVLLLDMLYRKEMYSDVVHCINILEKRQNFTVWTARGVGCFYLSSCLKINTPESLTNGLIYFEKLFKYRSPFVALTMLALVTALKTCPEKVDKCMKALDGQEGELKKNKAYSEIQTNIMLQHLAQSKLLSDIEMYVTCNKGTIAKDTFDSVVTLAEELGFKNPHNIFKGCNVLDVSLDEWVISENCRVADWESTIPRRPGTFRGRQEVLQ